MTSLTDYIKTSVLHFAKTHNVLNIDKEGNLDDVIKRVLSGVWKETKKRIVILLDDYDRPVVETYFDDSVLSKKREDVIRMFFHALKISSNVIHFALIFGATKIATTGETDNVIVDLTRDDTYSDLIGFTEQEIKEYYKDYLEKITCERNLKNSDVLIKKVVKPFYNHYKFTPNGGVVYSPISVTKYLYEKPVKPRSYWAEKVTLTSLLQNTVQRFPKTALDILCEDTIKIDMGFLNAKINRTYIDDGDSRELAKILFQTGFMSIKGNKRCPKRKLSSCILGVANKEAKDILVDCLREKMAECPLTVEKMEKLLRNRQFTEFMGALDYAVKWLVGDKYFTHETKYQQAIALILEMREYTFEGAKSAFVESLLHTEVEIERKYIDYAKRLPNLNVMFYLKKQDQGRAYVNLKEETMRCLGTYTKPYGKSKKYKNEEVLCVIISFYAVAEEGMQLENELKKKPTGFRSIHNWAAMEWFPEKGTIKTYNL